MISHWERLLGIARSIIDQSGIGDDWTFGGGTAMMVQIGHRLSHDIDLFVDDPQLLGYLDPSKQSFDFEIKPSAYAGDGNRFLKIAFDDLGEIDFVACSPLSAKPTKRIELHGRPIFIETIAEIITKKVFYRGSMITPRDVFDIAAAGKTHRREIVQALAGYPKKVSATITALERANPQYVLSVIGDLQINPDFESLKETAIEKCLAILRSALPSSQ